MYIKLSKSSDTAKYRTPIRTSRHIDRGRSTTFSADYKGQLHTYPVRICIVN